MYFAYREAGIKMVLSSAFHQRRESGLEGLFCLGLLGLMCLSVSLLVWQVFHPVPLILGGITFDRVSTLLTLLVAGIGTVTYCYSCRYLAGNPRRATFLRVLAVTILAAYLLMCSTNLLLLFVAWALTSLGLHQLLTIYGEHREAVRPARKKFLISRLGDIALIAAIVVIWQQWNTLNLHVFLAQIQHSPDHVAIPWVALLIALAALTKSAQFPFHSWLPETMESPTPVSALMHAGIINAGGALLIRFAPVLIHAPIVMLLLVTIGTVTFAIGMLAMWAQVKVKRILAWSTVSQMGFMMVQCGLGAFSLALLHILGHGCYKAWCFLASGELPSRGVRPVAPRWAVLLLIAGTLAALPLLYLASWVTGFQPVHSSGEIALTLMLALSLGHLCVALLAQPRISSLLFTLSLSALICIVAFALYGGVNAFLQPVVGVEMVLPGPLAILAAVIPIIALLALSFYFVLAPVIVQTAWGRALQIHALHGFYFGVLADRVVDSIWRKSFALPKGVEHAQVQRVL
jgi:NAD(P)H-quinone oxidoreductase subunit 5